MRMNTKIIPGNRSSGARTRLLQCGDISNIVRRQPWTDTIDVRWTTIGRTTQLISARRDVISCFRIGIVDLLKSIVISVTVSPVVLASNFEVLGLLDDL
jgi:hypothetical protein